DAGGLGRLPSKVPSASFAKALLQTLLREYQGFKEEKDSVDAAIVATRERIQGLRIDSALSDRLLAYLRATETSAGLQRTAAEALGQARARLDALPLRAADRKKVNAVLDRISASDGAVMASAPAVLEAIKDGLGAAGLEAELRQALTRAVDRVQEAVDTARAELVATVERLEADLALRFDTAMERVIGWYARQAKFGLFAIGFFLAAATNFNIIGYANDLVHNDDLRAKAVAQARIIEQTESLAKAREEIIPGRTDTGGASAPQTELAREASKVKLAAVESLKTVQKQLGTQGVSLGWSCGNFPSYCACAWNTLSTSAALLSWLIIAFACTMGGQFWFDALKKLMSVRSAVTGKAASGGDKASGEQKQT
ncbi:MAG TPA: hypothetical protein VLA52_08605, partial [Thermohalobaculum sp.]|nr:hypothetical protein [Thermohalobaculum sp.]